MNRIAVTSDLQFQQLVCLPPQHFVRQTLERFPEHRKPTPFGVASTEMQITEPALPSPISPFRSQNYQVERVRLLNLQPASAPSACRISSFHRFCHDAFMSSAQRLAQELSSGLGIPGHSVRDDS